MGTETTQEEMDALQDSDQNAYKVKLAEYVQKLRNRFRVVRLALEQEQSTPAEIGSMFQKSRDRKIAELTAEYKSLDSRLLAASRGKFLETGDMKDQLENSELRGMAARGGLLIRGQ
jgi:hypothetical protein